MHCSLCLLHISLLDKVFQQLLQIGFLSFAIQKKWSLVALNKWLSYTVTIVQEFALGGLPIGHLRRVVVLQRWSCEHVLLQCFKLISNNFACLMQKNRVEIFKCIISLSSTKSLVPPLHKCTIQTLDLFFPFFGKLDLLNSHVYSLPCQYFERIDTNLSHQKV